MTSFQGYEIVPAEGMVRHSRTTIRITVSAKKVCLSEPLIRALKNPSHIAFFRGVGENEGKMPSRGTLRFSGTPSSEPFLPS